MKIVAHIEQINDTAGTTSKNRHYNPPVRQVQRHAWLAPRHRCRPSSIDHPHYSLHGLRHALVYGRSSLPCWLHLGTLDKCADIAALPPDDTNVVLDTDAAYGRNRTTVRAHEAQAAFVSRRVLVRNTNAHASVTTQRCAPCLAAPPSS
jgi:hypothetical protein